MTAGPLVLGIGNSVRGDDGFGVHVVRTLTDGAAAGPPPALPAGTVVVDGGTCGLALLSDIVDAEAVVFVDAVDVGAPPGTLHVLRGDDLYSNLVRLSVHQVGASDLLAAARLLGTLPAEVVLVGVQPADLGPGTALSPPVAAMVPAAVSTVVEWCERLASQPA